MKIARSHTGATKTVAHNRTNAAIVTGQALTLDGDPADQPDHEFFNSHGCNRSLHSLRQGPPTTIW